MNSSQIVDLTDEPEPESAIKSFIAAKAPEPKHVYKAHLQIPLPASQPIIKSYLKAPTSLPIQPARRPFSKEPIKAPKDSKIIQSLMKPGSISDRLKELIVEKDEIYLEEIDEFRPVSQIVKNFRSQPTPEPSSNTNSEPKPNSHIIQNLRAKPQPQKFDERPYLNRPPKQLEGFLPRLHYNKEADCNALDRLLKWKSTISSDRVDIEVPQKRSREKDVPKDPDKKKFKNPFKVDLFLKQDEEEKRRNLLEEQEREKNRQIAQTEKEYREKMKGYESLPQPEITQEMIDEKERQERFKGKDDISEFYLFVVNLKLFNLEKIHQTPEIPISFRNGREYVNYFLPAFYEEFKGAISSALRQNDMSDASIVELRIFTTEFRCGYLAPGDEQPGKVSFYTSIKNDDLVLIVPYNGQRILPRFSDWDKNCPYFLGICERETRGKPWLLRVKEEEAIKLENPQYFYVVYVESLTTLIREFKTIKVAEFLELGNYIMSPNTRSYDGLPSVPQNFLKFIDNAYNSSQFDALHKISRKLEGITLLQGPPGTGKTHTVIGILSSFLLSKGNTKKPKVLVCAPSNAAVDEIAVRAIKQGLYTETGSRRGDLNLVRIGLQNFHIEIRQKNPNDIREPPKEIKKIALESLVSEKLKSEGFSDNYDIVNQLRKELNNIEKDLNNKRKSKNNADTLISELKEKRKRVQENLHREKGSNLKNREKKNLIKREILENADVVFCTLSGAGSKDLLEIKTSFDYVLIDEACQSIELSTLIPLQYEVKHVVLVGDPKQLPSTTFSMNSPRVGYNRSLFERLMIGGTDVIMLEIQYRMTKEICCFPSVHFYESRLIGQDDLESRQRPFWMPSQELIFFDLQTSNETKSSEEVSILNKPEAHFIVDLYASFANVHRMKLNIGIITPYRRQVRTIKSILDQRYQGNWKKDVEVNTVDGFQGREKDLILFSAVRSGDSIGFLADSRRMNVAITRAKFGLWIVGKAQCLEKNNDWNQLLISMRERNFVIECRNFGEIQSIFSKREETKAIRNDVIPIKKKAPAIPRKAYKPAQEIKSSQSLFGNKKKIEENSENLESLAMKIINRN